MLQHLWKKVRDLKCPICGEHPVIGPCDMVNSKVVEFELECDSENHRIFICNETRQGAIEIWKKHFGQKEGS